MIAPTRDYIERRCAQIAAACGNRDGDTAVAIIQLIRADGFREFADQLLKGLVETGLDNMARAAGTTR